MKSTLEFTLMVLATLVVDSDAQVIFSDDFDDNTNGGWTYRTLP